MENDSDEHGGTQLFGRHALLGVIKEFQWINRDKLILLIDMSMSVMCEPTCVFLAAQAGFPHHKAKSPNIAFRQVFAFYWEKILSLDFRSVVAVMTISQRPKHGLMKLTEECPRT